MTDFEYAEIKTSIICLLMEGREKLREAMDLCGYIDPSSEVGEWHLHDKFGTSLPVIRNASECISNAIKEVEST